MSVQEYKRGVDGRGWAWPAVYLNSAAQVPGNVGAGVQKGRGWAWPADQPGGAEPAVLPGAARVMAPLPPGQDACSPLHTQEVSQIRCKRQSLTFLHFTEFSISALPYITIHLANCVLVMNTPCMDFLFVKVFSACSVTTPAYTGRQFFLI
jgi:hypothetical protein